MASPQPHTSIRRIRELAPMKSSVGVETSRLHCYNNGIAAAAHITPSYSRGGANEVVDTFWMPS